MQEGTFALVPLEVIQDRRLTLEQTRVLISLFSFRNRSTNTVWPSRKTISERTGMHPSNISAATTALVSFGWLVKEGDGGRSKATRYTITVPDLETVAEQDTVAQSATKTVAERATQTVADSARGKEHTSEHTSEQTNDASTVPVNAARGKPAGKKPTLTPAMQEACRETWAEYVKGYAERYAVDPMFNAKVAGQVVQFVKRVGMEEAPQIARWFPSHQSAYYVGRGHVVDCLLRDAEKLRTEWATGRVVTSTAARQADRRGAMADTVQKLLRECEQQEGRA